jgi:phosphatidylglycerophosphate synthase
VTTALLIATAPAVEGQGTASLLIAGHQALVARMTRQARDAGASEVAVIARPVDADVVARLSGANKVLVAHTPADELEAIASIAREGYGLLLVADASWVGHDAVLARMAGDPRVPSGVLGAPEPADLRVEYSRVVSAGSVCHAVARPTGSFAGVIKLAAEERERLAWVADAIAADLRRGDAWTDPITHPVLPVALVGLLRSGVVLPHAEVRELVWRHAAQDADVASAQAAMTAVDEDKVVLRSAVKSEDGFFTTFFVSPYSRYVARAAANIGLSPNQVTMISLVVGLLAALAFAGGSKPWLVIGAILLQISFTLDCVDGQLARYTLQFSARGAWLDAVFDRTKEVAAFAGLAAGGTSLWTLATIALGLQVFRHMVDFSYAANLRRTEARVLPMSQHIDEMEGAGAPASVARRTVGLLGRADRTAFLRYLKRSIAFPIGERFAVISLVAAFAGAHQVFVVVLVWGAVATLYTTGGRVLRSLA